MSPLHPQSMALSTTGIDSALIIRSRDGTISAVALLAFPRNYVKEHKINNC